MLQVEQIPFSAMMTIQAAAKTSHAGESVGSFVEARRKAMQELSEDGRMEWFQNRFYQQLEQIPADASVVNGAVDVSPAGFQSLETDPSYRDQVLGLIARDLGSSYEPRQASVYIKVGRDLSEYHTRSWSAGDDLEYRKLTADSFFTRTYGASRVREMETFTPSAFHIFRDHLQMQLEKLDNAPAPVTDRRDETRSNAYEAMAYERPDIRAFEA